MCKYPKVFAHGSNNVGVCCFLVFKGLTVRVHGCVLHYMLPPGSVVVSGLWFCYFGVHRLKSLGTPGAENRARGLCSEDAASAHGVRILPTELCPPSAEF